MDSVPFSARFGERHVSALLPGILNCRCCSSNVSRKRTLCFCTQYNASESVPLCVVPGLRLYDTKSHRTRRFHLVSKLSSCNYSVPVSIFLTLSSAIACVPSSGNPTMLMLLCRCALLKDSMILYRALSVSPASGVEPA